MAGQPHRSGRMTGEIPTLGGLSVNPRVNREDNYLMPFTNKDGVTIFEDAFDEAGLAVLIMRLNHLREQK